MCVCLRACACRCVRTYPCVRDCALMCTCACLRVCVYISVSTCEAVCLRARERKQKVEVAAATQTRAAARGKCILEIYSEYDSARSSPQRGSGRDGSLSIYCNERVELK